MKFLKFINKKIIKNLVLYIALFFTVLLSFVPSITDYLYSLDERIFLEHNSSSGYSSLEELKAAEESEPSEEEQNPEPEGESAQNSEQNNNPGTSNGAASNKTSGGNQNNASPPHSAPAYPQLPSPPPASSGKHVVGYYMGWSRYKGFLPEHISASRLTHLSYAFANLGSDLKIYMADSSADTLNFAALRNIKKANPHLRTLIAVGGWDYSKYFSNAALNEQNRNTFAQNCLDFILQHGFDGVDIDWEYPVSGGLAGNIYRTEDKQNLTLLMKALRNKLNEQSARDGRNYYLTTTAAPGAWYLTKIEAKNLASVADFIFIMGYDFSGPWDNTAHHNAPLYARTDIPSAGQGSVSEGLNAFLNAGVPASKLVLGVPFYGYQYSVVSPANNGLGNKFTGSGSVPFDNVVSNFLNNPVYTLFYDETSRVPYLFGNNTFISFDNEQSITEKTNFAKAKGCAGVGAWELSFDKNAKLLGAIKNVLK